MSNKNKKVCATLNYNEHVLISNSTFTASNSIYAYVSLAGFSIRITGAAIGLNCAITVEIKTYTSVIKKNKKKHDKMVLLAENKLNSAEVLISKSLIDSYIVQGELVLVTNLLKKYENIKKETKILRSLTIHCNDFNLFIKQGYRIV